MTLPSSSSMSLVSPASVYLLLYSDGLLYLLVKASSGGEAVPAQAVAHFFVVTAHMQCIQQPGQLPPDSSIKPLQSIHGSQQLRACLQAINWGGLHQFLLQGHTV
jgi:hypothetical protein